MPIAVTGIDVGKLLSGAEEMRKVCETQVSPTAWRYAAARYRLYRAGRSVEHPQLLYVRRLPLEQLHLQRLGSFLSSAAKAAILGPAGNGLRSSMV